MQDWHHLDERIDAVTGEIEALVAADEASQRLMSVPGVGPIIASAMVATASATDLPSGSRNDDLRLLGTSAVPCESRPSVYFREVPIAVVPAFTQRSVC